MCQKCKGDWFFNNIILKCSASELSVPQQNFYDLSAAKWIAENIVVMKSPFTNIAYFQSQYG